jgi:hypothetical protein
MRINTFAAEEKAKRHRKWQRLKLGGGQAYYSSSD